MKTLLFIILFTLSVSQANTTRTPLIISEKFESVYFEIEKLLQKYGYTNIETQTHTDTYKRQFYYTTIQADPLSPKYAEFLNELFQIDRVHSMRYVGQDFGDQDIITLELSNSIQESDFIKALIALQKSGAWVLKATERIRISIPIQDAEQYLETLSNLKLFSKYQRNSSVPEKSEYFSDLNKTGTYDLELGIDIKLNPKYVLKEISSQFTFEVISQTTTHSQTQVVVRLPNNIGLIDTLRFYLMFSPLNVKILNLPSELAYHNVRILRPHTTYTFIPHNIHTFMVQKGVQQTELELDRVSRVLQNLGFNVTGFNITPEMGEGYWIDIQLKSPLPISSLEPVMEVGKLFLNDGQHPNSYNEIVSCKSFFSKR